MDSDEIAQILGDDGPLAKQIPGFSCRSKQIEMAQTIAQAISTGQPAILEAGTGTGKSFAYLVPILLSGAKAIVSTSTKGLQEQLITKDIPILTAALQIGIDVRMLKGRGNYLCRYRIAQAQRHDLAGEIFPQDRNIDRDLKAVVDYVASTSDGSQSGVKHVKSFSKVWPLVTSTHANCLGAKCGDFNDCFVYQARNKARTAQVVIVNHALLLTNAARQRDGQGELLPNFDICIFDEAHKLTEDLSHHFATRFATEELTRTLLETETLIQVVWPEKTKLVATFARLRESCTVLITACQNLDKSSVFAAAALKNKKVAKALANFVQALQEADQICEFIDDDNSIIEACLTLVRNGRESLLHWTEADRDVVCWLETRRDGVVFLQAPVHVDELFRNYVVAQRTTVLISATMSVANKLDHVQNQLGLADASAQVWDSPFDYCNNSRLLIPQNMSDPSNEQDFIKGLVDLAVPLIEANNGSAFILFTSWRNLRIGAQLLQKSLQSDYNILVQSDKPPEQLLQEFRQGNGKKVLLGTRTFWQGVDVPGKALSLVIIDKIPFMSPEDPMLVVQMRQLDDEKEAFFKVQLPKAALALKQAAGRLIRGVHDRGVLVICDPRLITKSYGEIIIDSLPPMKRIYDLNEAITFLRNIQ